MFHIRSCLASCDLQTYYVPPLAKEFFPPVRSRPAVLFRAYVLCLVFVSLRKFCARKIIMTVEL